RRAWLCRHAQRLDLSDSVSVDLADHGSDAGLYADLECARLGPATQRLSIHKSSTGALLLRAVSGGGLVRRMLRVCARTQRALALVVVAVPAALLLSPGDVLRNGQVSRHRNSRRRG